MLRPTPTSLPGCPCKYFGVSALPRGWGSALDAPKGGEGSAVDTAPACRSAGGAGGLHRDLGTSRKPWADLLLTLRTERECSVEGRTSSCSPCVPAGVQQGSEQVGQELQGLKAWEQGGDRILPGVPLDGLGHWFPSEGVRTTGGTCWPVQGYVEHNQSWRKIK